MNLSQPPSASVNVRSKGLYALAWSRILKERVALICMAVMLLYFVLVLLCATGLIAKNWNSEVALAYAPPAWMGAAAVAKAAPAAAPSAAQREAEQQLETWLQNTVPDPLGDAYRAAKAAAEETRAAQPPRAATAPWGADRWGRDVFDKTLHGAQTSLLVGLGAAFLATLIGVMLGLLAGYLGGGVDAVCDWLYSLFNAIPYLLLILAIAAVLNSSGAGTMVLIFGLTGWTGVYRLIRAETLRQRGREYLRAAAALGVPHWQRILRHILPNTHHIVLVQISILTVGFIKAEVILSFLGFGVPVSEVSWGSMLNEAQNELLLGYWWQLTAATVAMAGLITAWSVFTDSLRDALDPKLK